MLQANCLHLNPTSGPRTRTSFLARSRQRKLSAIFCVASFLVSLCPFFVMPKQFTLSSEFAQALQTPPSLYSLYLKKEENFNIRVFPSPGTLGPPPPRRRPLFRGRPGPPGPSAPMAPPKTGLSRAPCDRCAGPVAARAWSGLRDLRGFPAPGPNPPLREPGPRARPATSFRTPSLRLETCPVSWPLFLCL